MLLHYLPIINILLVDTETSHSKFGIFQEENAFILSHMLMPVS